MTAVRRLTQYVPLRTRSSGMLVENAAKSLVSLVRAMRAGDWRAPDAGLKNPRQK